MSVKDVPVLLITGYLGSGKTTLLNRILNNKKGLKFAVVVNDIGEVNIDADLIQRGGVVNSNDDSLVSLQNGCICCTLQQDLIDQLYNLLKMRRFDYIVIEASGVCDPAPIANTIASFPQLGQAYSKYGRLYLDSVVTVVDALRMKDEFKCAEKLNPMETGEDDIENLLIQQVEFCNMVLLNKASEVNPSELDRIKQVIRALQPKARILECDYADVNLNWLVESHGFNYNEVAMSAGWIKELDKPAEDDRHHHEHHHDDDHDCHHHDEHDEQCHHHEHHSDDCHEHHHDHECHCHEDGHECHCNEHHHDHDHECHCGHHHHHNEDGETEEYGIGTYVYYRRGPFDINKFDFFISKVWPKNIIRAKGICYFQDEYDMAYIFEQAGSQKQLSQLGRWYASLPLEEQQRMRQMEPALDNDWDDEYGDRMIKLVFIGQKLNKKDLSEALDFCLFESEK